MSPFDFLNAINYTKQNLFEDPQASKDYAPFMVNRGLSYFPDTIMYANVMNQFYDTPKDWQFSYFINSIPKKKRFSKWAKKEETSESIESVKEYFGYSTRQAERVMNVLTDEQLTMIKRKLFRGGNS
jgi:hypothetical protein